MSITPPVSSTPFHSRTRTNLLTEPFPRPVGCGRGRILDAIMANKTKHHVSQRRSPIMMSPRSSPTPSIDSPRSTPPPLLDSDEDHVTPACICSRPIKIVFCRACGKMRQGRINLRCSFHPNLIHLMDLSVCPNCKNSNIIER